MVNTTKKLKAFTLIELLVVMSVIALLLAIAMPRYFKGLDRSKDAALKQDLSIMRDALDKYYGDNASYPTKLEDLVEKHYLRDIPEDPITESATTWLTIAPKDSRKGKIFDIKSGAIGQSVDGVPYRDF
jgi:general secretion pathway protein G